MPGYTKRAPKGKKKSWRHHGSSPVRRHDVPVTEQTMKQDPFCAYMLGAARETEDAGMAEHFRQTAVCEWKERHPPASVELPPRAMGSCELEERSAPLLVFSEEEETEEPVWLGAGAFALTPPEPEFGSVDLEEPDAPLYVSVGALVMAPPEKEFESGESEEDESEGKASCPSPTPAAPQTSGEEKETSPTPPAHPETTEDEVSPPPSVYSDSTVYYGEGEDVSLHVVMSMLVLPWVWGVCERVR
ncbi:uncharacterized protein LOC143508919 [Brachyhypopomus gauderio]|uniref:uncharacterized protein LOC143508399 n=1 Tax=Brachyhypopomus gauderio TaxID=698409 RepID=UPI004041CDCB